MNNYQRFFLRFIIAFSLLAIICGCVKEDEARVQKDLHDVVFHAGWAPETKTVLQEDGSVWWSPGDKISLTVDNGSNGFYCLTSTNTSPAAQTDFVGTIEEGTVYSAIYPYSPYNYYDGEYFHLDFFNNAQVAQEGSFQKDAFVSIAQSKDNNLFFKNVCGGIKFSVVNEGITHIRFQTDVGAIGGHLLYRINENGIPEYAGLENGGQAGTTIYAPNHDTFEPNKDYYVVLPSMQIEGITITAYKGEKSDKISYQDTIEIHRSTFKRLEGIDKDMRFPQDHNENAAILYEFLPDNIDRKIITGIEFHVNNSMTTDYQLSASSPVYYDVEGTIVNLYTTEDYFDISNITYQMFFEYMSLKELDLSKTLVNTATSFEMMFYGCISLESIQFGNWDTFYLTDMAGMFSGCRQLRSLDLSFMDTHNVEIMQAVFAECWNLSSLDLSSFETSKVTDMTSMFFACKKLQSLNISTFNTSNVINMRAMFSNCCMLKEIDLSHFDTRNVISMAGMFEFCQSLTKLNLSSFNTSSVTSFYCMFYGCLGIESLNLSTFLTHSAQDMTFMFSYCMSLKELDISSFSSESLTTANWMFGSCSRLQKLNLGDFDISQANCEGICSAMMQISKAGVIRCMPNTRAKLEPTMDTNLEGRVVWMGLSDDINTYEYQRNPDLYYSSDFSKHKTVKKLYSATKGKGIDIVLMGDVYSDRMIANGQYDADMELAVEAIFSKEPMASFKEYFNVYILYLVSDNEVIGESTALCSNGSGTGVLDGYATANVPENYRILATGSGDITVSDAIVVINGQHSVTGYAEMSGIGGASNDWEGDGSMGDYGFGFAAVVVARGDPSVTELFKVTVAHEFGHSFAKLADEYATKNMEIEDSFPITNNMCGWYKNVDITSDPAAIKWSQFLSDERYAADGVGIFEGGFDYTRGVYRPSENSIMNTGTEFNAPSRAAIYNRIHKLAYGKDWQFNYETFAQWDQKNIGLESRYRKAGANTYHPHLKHKPFFEFQKKTIRNGLWEYHILMN